MMIFRSLVVRFGSGGEGIAFSLASRWCTAELTVLQAGPFWAPTAPSGRSTATGLFYVININKLITKLGYSLISGECLYEVQ